MERYTQPPLETPSESPQDALQREIPQSEDFHDLFQFENANRDRLGLPAVVPDEFQQMLEGALYDGMEGGNAVFQKYGRDYMAEIGRKGYEATRDKYFGGSDEKYQLYLARRSMEVSDPAPWNEAHQFSMRFPKEMTPFETPDDTVDAFALDGALFDALPQQEPPPIDFTEKSASEATSKIREAMRQYTTEEGFKKYLDFQAKQHGYSPYNCMLILSQRPDATMVMPYGAKDGSTGWKSMGRFVKKGETGISILAPMFRKKSENDENPIGFKRVYVYDLSQTDGKPLPSPKMPEQLDGNDPIGDELFSRLADFVDDLGIDIQRRPFKSANGAYLPYEGKILLNDKNHGDQELKTMTHEVAHVLTDFKGKDLVDAETIAEMAAYVTLGHFGIDTSAYSTAYIGNWAKDLVRFEANVFTGQKIAKDLINAVTVGRSPWALQKGGR